MKRLFVLTAAVLLGFNVQAQSLEQGIKLINYERYESAKKALEPLAAKSAEANYYLGLANLGIGDTAAAIQVFSKNLNDDFYSKAGMARVYFMQGKKEQAGKLLNQIVDNARKKDWEKYKAAADAITYSKGGDVQKAIEWYQKAIEKEDKNADLYIGLGDAYLKLQTGGGNAMDNYQKAAQIGTNNSLAYSREGYLWYVAHNYEAALMSYNQAKEADPSNPLPYRDLARAYQRAGKYDNALKNIEEYLAKSDQSTTDQITYANLLFLAKKYPEAEAKMEELLAKGVEKPYMYRIIGYSAYETKNYEKALKNMRLFFEKETNPAMVINDDYIYTGKAMLAIAANDTIPSDSLKVKNFIDSATYYFNTAVAKDTATDKSELYRSIAEGFKVARQYKDAGDWYGKVVANDSAAAALDYFWWGYYSYYGKNYEVAADAFKQMRAKFPKEGSAIYWQARVAAAKDNEAKTGLAVPYYKEWLAFEQEGYEHKPADLMYAYQYLAYYYYNKKDQAQAMEWVNKILEADPGNEFAASVKKYYDDLAKQKQK